MFERMIKWFERMGAARAASELARQGYHEHAKKIMMQVR